ncbi:hypothetical protein [Methanobacterium alcaliphilum]|uniref:hypothetical protein n=1 Tax=Methanobacterium alcaliphilum TaxID=392018 RepID=UPI00200B50C9|nr:hypothetical protein [Methanobacterium alcaliphilum]MCK9152002.1 hypothetical protein [Methanobacterium alcaliphilum]
MGEIKEIKSIPVVQFALVVGGITGILGLIWSFLITLFGVSLLTFVPSQQLSTVIAGGIFGAIFIILFVTISSFIMGFVTYALIAIIYNFLASKIGGVRIELE